MKRRTLLQVLGAGCVLGPAGMGATADPGPGQAAARSLVAVHDQLPAAVLTSIRRYRQLEWMAPPDPVRLPTVSDGWSHGIYPLVIGLGPRAEALVDQLPQRLILPEDVGLYRSGPAGNARGEDWFQLRLAHCASALIVVDATDPQALAAAADWTGQLVQAGVYLHARVVVEVPDDAQDPDWLGVLPSPTLVVRQHATALDPLGTIAAMLYGLPCLHQSFCGYDAADLRMMLELGPRAFATAVRWTDREGLASAFATAYTALSPGDCRGAILFLSTGSDFRLAEFDEAANQLAAWLPLDAPACLVPLVIPGLAKGERVFNLTLMGA
jgi:hypothetical protein